MSAQLALGLCLLVPLLIGLLPGLAVAQDDTIPVVIER